LRFKINLQLSLHHVFIPATAFQTAIGHHFYDEEAGQLA